MGIKPRGATISKISLCTLNRIGTGANMTNTNLLLKSDRFLKIFENRGVGVLWGGEGCNNIENVVVYLKSGWEGCNNNTR